MSTAIQAALSPRSPTTIEAMTQLKADHAKFSSLLAEYVVESDREDRLSVPEAPIGHASLKDLMARIDAVDPAARYTTQR